MTTALAIVAVVISVLALVVAVWAALISRRNALAAEDSAESARRVAKAEHAREHRELAPKPDWVRFETAHNERTGQANLFVHVTPPRTYVTFSDLLFEAGGRSPAHPVGGNVIEGGVEVRMFIAADEASLPDEVEMRFFPPTPNAPGERWTCACGEPTVGDHTARGHWILRVKVENLLSLGLY